MKFRLHISFPSLQSRTPEAASEANRRGERREEEEEKQVTRKFRDEEPFDESANLASTSEFARVPLILATQSLPARSPSARTVKDAAVGETYLSDVLDFLAEFCCYRSAIRRQQPALCEI